MEKALKFFMANKDPVEAVRTYADGARRFDKSLDMEGSINIGRKQAYNMFTDAGEHGKAAKAMGVTFSDCIRSRCTGRSLGRFSENDIEPGDSGSNHDQYVAAKHARRNGLRR